MSERVAIVTGGASGIGKAIAEALAHSGDQVVIADLNETEGKGLADTIGGYFVKADFSQRIDCKRLVDETLAHYGEAHILINNAGFQHIDPIEVFPEDTWDEMLRVMLTAPFLLTKYVWGTMKTRGWGRIVNISSIHGRGCFALQECLHHSQTRPHRPHANGRTGGRRTRYHRQRHLPGLLSAHHWLRTKLLTKHGHVGFR